MSGDLRAAVEGETAHERHLREQTFSLYCVGCGTWPPPEGAVLVTEETLAAAIDAHWADPMPRHEKGPGCAADIVRHLREET